MNHIILTILLLTGCRYVTKHESKQHDGVDLSDLKAKYALVYQEVENGSDDTTGWPSTQDCDSLLWAGIACSVGLPVQIDRAEYNPGEIHRRPEKLCYSDELGDIGAKSTISRDMLTGYMSCLWTRKDLAAFQRLADYGDKYDLYV